MKRYLTFLFALMTAIALNAQCNINSHSTSWFDAWTSCETSPNPKSSYGDTHWILYDLGYEYPLYDAKLWNLNDPAHLDNGIKDYEVDYSLDGANWTHFGTFTLSQGTGQPDYFGEAGPHFEGITARFILITPTSNYGGDCYGFSEIKIKLTDAADTGDYAGASELYLFPNPVEDHLVIRFVSDYQPAPVSYAVFDLSGRKIFDGTFEQEGTVTETVLSQEVEKLMPGIYFLNVEKEGVKLTMKFIKK